MLASFVRNRFSCSKERNIFQKHIICTLWNFLHWCVGKCLMGIWKVLDSEVFMCLVRLRFCPGSESHIISLWKTLQHILEIGNWVGNRDNVRRGKSACACETTSSKMLETKYISSEIGDLKNQWLVYVRELCHLVW